MRGARFIVVAGPRHTLRPNGGVARAFSSQSSSPSSSSPSAAPSLLTGWEARWRLLQRNMMRLPRLVEYQERQVFAPSLSVVHHALLFYVLNAPQRLDLDICDFLEGAATATKRILEDANSADFVKLVSADAAARMAPSATIERMQAYCLPHCFQQLQIGLQRVLAQNVSLDMLDVRVDSACVTRAGYARLTEREHEWELRGMHFTPERLRARREFEDTDGEEPTVERLQLQVEVRTYERVKRTLRMPDTTQESVIQQHNVYNAKFTSIVTTPDELDWRLTSIAIRTKGRPVELSRTTTARLASQQHAKL